MALKLPSAFLVAELGALIAWWATRGTQVCHLFTNPAFVYNGNHLSDFTEASWPGYAPVNLGVWSAPTFATPDAVTTETAPCTFINSGTSPVILYGYFLTDGTGGLVWAERDPSAPITLGVGQQYQITLRRSHRNLGE